MNKTEFIEAVAKKGEMTKLMPRRLSQLSVTSLQIR